VLTTCSRQTVAAGGGGAQSDPIARACGRAGVDRTRAWAGGLGLGPRTRSRLPVGLGAERSPSLEGLPVPYSVEPGGGASDSDRWRDPSCASRWRSVASVHGSVGGRGGGAGPISGAVNAHVTRAGHLGVSQWRVSDVLSGAGPVPTGGGAATDAPARIARDRRVTAA
jgi:hypothetical protein